MSTGKIKIKYHPIKKEMYFFRWENPGWPEIASHNSCLAKYFFTKKGNIVLQDLGNEFFNDIHIAMGSIENITVDFEGTKLDYGDLKIMIDYYNKSTGKKFKVGNLIELPNVQDIYENIKQYTEDVVSEFENRVSQSENLSLNSTLEKAIAELRKKIAALEKNDINLCFVGTYSSGKSTLINAMLGYAILPEAIKSETAKMFKVINSDDQMKIVFTINKNKEDFITILRWDDSEKTFSFESGPHEDRIRVAIQKTIYNHITALQHEQAREILSLLNKEKSFYNTTDENESTIKGIIEIYCKIPLNEKINFTIFDTPGTDSNTEEHLDILQNALQEQTNSILIFVNWPNKEEGKGNQVLVELLNSISKKAESNSTIDLSRSLYVMNGCDSLTDQQAFTDLKEGSLTIQKREDRSIDDIEIILSEKRLFFTSASAAYAAKAFKNGVETGKEKNLIKKYHYELIEDENAGYYKYNTLAQSQHETEEMVMEAQQLVEEAKSKNDIITMFLVNSGIHSLEKEIVKYGEKYALAVKAKGIIDAVNVLINIMQSKYNALKTAAEQDKGSLDKKIDTLRGTLKHEIKDCCEKAKLKSKQQIDESEQFLEISRTDIDKLHENGEAVCNDMRSWTIKDGAFKKAHDDICNRLTRIASNHKNTFIQKRRALLEQDRDDLVKKIKDIIDNCKDIDPATKRAIAQINTVPIPDPQISDQLTLQQFRKRDILFIKRLDKKKYQKEVMSVFRIELDERKKICKTDINTTWPGICDRVCKEFVNKIDDFSKDIEELMTDRGSIEQKIKQLDDVLNTVKQKQDLLNKKIWGGKENEQTI